MPQGITALTPVNTLAPRRLDIPRPGRKWEEHDHAQTQDPDHGRRGVSALAITALGPAAASHGKGVIAVVNGIPGVKVDICINGKEIRSRLSYGGKVFRTMHPGKKVLKVFKTDRRKCRGVKLAKKSFRLAAVGPGFPTKADLTLVVTRKSPKVLVFDNRGQGLLPPDGPASPNWYFAWRHAADLGGVNVFRRVLTASPEAPVGTAVNKVWLKGEVLSAGQGDIPGGLGFILRATRPESASTLAKSAAVMFDIGRRYEWYLLGTRASNAKWLVFSRAIAAHPVS